MKQFKIVSSGIAMLIFFLAFSGNGTPKTQVKHQVTGVVSDTQGPLPGANVVIKGTNTAVQTDIDGKYAINASEGDILIFSFVGLQTKSVTVRKRTVINVKLENAVTLSEVVVTGYKTSAKRKTAVAQSAVSYDQLSGRVAGISISNANGYVNTAAPNQVVIRGIASRPTGSEPLYIVDGKPVAADDFKKIASADIKSVKVLKDKAATKLYGARAANGACIVTTATGNYQFPEPNDEDYDSFVENAFTSPKNEPLSTFSIDVDNASYTNVRRFLNMGQKVPKDAVRVEEMVNFFKYDYPQPNGKDPFSIHTEYAECPWNKQNKLLRIGLQGKNIPTDDLPASNLVFLIDVSGSMGAPNKLPLLKESMKVLVAQLRKQDKVAMVVYAGNAGLVLPSTSGSEKGKIIGALDQLESGGSTAGGAGIELAYKIAAENFIRGGNNRVVLATDGDFNVGASGNSDMEKLIEQKRQTGVFLTVLGFGMGNYKDSKMEILADKGNGNYAYIDNIQEANRFLGKEFKGSMYAIAKDVKIQIEFNPKYVQSYRLIGYENRKLRPEDFTNDKIDAGELGSGHTVTALYEIIPQGVASTFFTDNTNLKYTQTNPVSGFADELATVKFRYKKPDGDSSTEMVQVIANRSESENATSADMKFSAAVAWFGLTLRESKLIPATDVRDIKKLAQQGLAKDQEGYRSEFVRLVDANATLAQK